MFKQGRNTPALKVKTVVTEILKLRISFVFSMFTIRKAVVTPIDITVQRIRAILSTRVDFPPGIIFTRLKKRIMYDM